MSQMLKELKRPIPIKKMTRAARENGATTMKMQRTGSNRVPVKVGDLAEDLLTNNGLPVLCLVLQLATILCSVRPPAKR
jgi:hypothetical protein